MTVLFVLVPVLLLFGWASLAYNWLVRARNQQSKAWSGIDVQLKKRADLIPPLAACVSAYAAHESHVFRETSRARSQQDLVSDLRKLIALAESYPDLRASSNFQDLMAELVKIEDDLQYARRFFNGSVRDFRNLAESFPTNLIAGVFGFVPNGFFEMETVLEKSATGAL
jgi:LemA protein